MTDAGAGAAQPRARRAVLVASTAVIVLFAAALVAILGGWWRKGGDEARPAGAAVRAYFGELHDGSAIDRWTVVRVYDVRAGAIPVVLATKEGARYQVDLLRRDPSGPTGVAETDAVSLFFANAGDGGVATPEEQGLGVMALAEALRSREAGGAKPPPLATMSERMGAGHRRFDVPLQ